MLVTMADSRHIYFGSFIAGVLVTAALTEIYHRYQQSQTSSETSKKSGFKTVNPDDEKLLSSVRHGPPAIVDGVEGCIGNTPLFRIKSLSEETGCEILAKAEFLNGAGGSPKDRVALSMIETAEREGSLRPHSGDVIYEGTSGSTGISLATLARARGYLAHICMPSDQAMEKSDLLLKLGAVVDRVPPAPIVEQGNFVNRARNLARERTASSNNTPNKLSSTSGTQLTTTDPTTEPGAATGRGFFTDQFENAANYAAHFNGTGPEIYAQCGGKLDAFVAGAGTGGTISGVALFLKPRLPDIKIILADPQGSGLYNRVRYGVMFDIKEREGTRRRPQVDTIVEGIGINRQTANFEAGRELIDDAIRVTDAQAMAMARWLVEKDGIFMGSSSAVNCFAAVKTALKLGPGHCIVTVLTDTGARHLSKFWAMAGDVGGTTDTKLEDVLNA
ncbi:cysteine synthase, putative [Talaromyces stipitatus ATCC 10500]|uniref:Cysteine synthase 2 n=1 Tax=Talaromyces stipitatus (strain ATCC 10500 / CBS 375.48 / QM 6759 / NRRL 1006) TaxID=441959 RepID=B8MF97_TALSN|nr:cysteine synthase, putative [Talaromyces stipitatus ATCC 10500]EED16196.1 cysteine synthase, putative [Talaromyces stipitatus ATCC 10500]